MKVAFNLSSTVSFEYTAELYPTYMRASGIGIAAGVGNLGCICMPWVIIYLSEVNKYSGYLVISICSLIGGVSTMLLPFDTYERELDQKVDSV